MKRAFLLSKGQLCLYDKQNNTWLLVVMEFLFSCLTRPDILVFYPPESEKFQTNYLVVNMKAIFAVMNTT